MVSGWVWSTNHLAKHSPTINNTQPISSAHVASGAAEQQRMRIAIAGSGLPPENPLVLEAPRMDGWLVNGLNPVELPCGSIAKEAGEW